MAMRLIDMPQGSIQGNAPQCALSLAINSCSLVD
ncbi:hypothetical protein LINPERPRIM_LOCUS35776 [Linum perenne]